MSKRSVKIVILFLLIIIVLVGGWNLFRKLEHNKESFSADIYHYLSPTAEAVIHINKEYSIQDTYVFYPSIKDLTDVFNGDYSLPIVILIYENGESVLLAKANHEQESDIKNFINSQMALPYSVKKRQYKDTELLFYTLKDGGFLICTFHKGIFAVSKDYKPIEKFIDSDSENTFFTNSKNKELIDKMIRNTSVSIFHKLRDNLFIADYMIHKDSIKLEGYIIETTKIKPDSLRLDYSIIPYLISIPDSLCIDSYNLDTINELARVKIFINKKF